MRYDHTRNMSTTGQRYRCGEAYFTRPTTKQLKTYRLLNGAVRWHGDDFERTGHLNDRDGCRDAIDCLLTQIKAKYGDVQAYLSEYVQHMKKRDNEERSERARNQNHTDAEESAGTDKEIL